MTPAPYAGNNAITLNAVARFAPTARGVAVVHPDAADSELKALDKGGIRGIRFSMANPATQRLTADMIEPLSRRVNDLGWHVQVYMRGDQIVAASEVLNRLATPIVFDHMGGLCGPDGVHRAGFDVIRRLLDKGRTWVKLSGPYLQFEIGPNGAVSLPTTNHYEVASDLARSYVSAATERLVWGSDWPHPSFGPDQKPDDAVLLDLLSNWAPKESARQRILVENPAKLYGFNA